MRLRLERILINVIVLFFLFVILLSLFNISPFISFLYNKIEITCNLVDGQSSSSCEALMKRINKERSGIEIRYQSKDEVLKGLFPSNVINILDKNPLSDSFKIRLLGKIGAEDFERFVGSLSGIEGIEKISFSKESANFLSKLQNVLLKSFLWMAGIYLFGIIIILSCLSGIEIRLYKEEREILYLSGRTKWSLSLSSIISSMIDGLLGSLVALFFLFLGYALFVQGLRFFGFEVIFFSPDIILSLLGVGILFAFVTKIPILFFI